MLLKGDPMNTSVRQAAGNAVGAGAYISPNNLPSIETKWYNRDIYFATGQHETTLPVCLLPTQW
jgi:hypothetical protein